jgi:hemolysin III
MTQLQSDARSIAVIAFVWCAAIAGIAVKLFLPRRFDRLAVGFYLLIGWSGIVVFGPLVDALPSMSLWLILSGGIVYSVGVVFYAWRGLKFRAAVWHGFVVAGAGTHFVAISEALILTRLF